MSDLVQPLVEYYHSTKGINRMFLDWVIIHGTIAYTASRLFRQALAYIFIRSEKDLAIWLHYVNKRRRQGHHADLAQCNDERCANI